MDTMHVEEAPAGHRTYYSGRSECGKLWVFRCDCGSTFSVELASMRATGMRPPSVGDLIQQHIESVGAKRSMH